MFHVLVIYVIDVVLVLADGSFKSKRKVAPTPEEMAMLEARRQCVKENVTRKGDVLRICISLNQIENVKYTRMNQAGLVECIVRAVNSCHPHHLHLVLYESLMLGVWQGGSLLASSPDFDAMCVTKAEYEELGWRFFH
ncbi:actin-related protein 6 [Tanacetum coccineum]